jgi:hypothetical protein
MISSLVFSVAALLQTSAPAPAVTFELIDYADFRGTTLTLAVGRGASCSVTLGAGGPGGRCTLAIPPGADSLTVSGELRLIDAQRRPLRARGSKTFRLLDLGPLFAPLRDRSTPFGARVRAFIQAKTALEKRHPDLETAVVSVAESGPAKPADVGAAERRLGFRLPREHVELLQDIGELEIEDSSTSTAAEITNAWDAMVKQWGTPLRELERETSPATRALFRASALLFTEVGDGLGGLLFHPAAAACGGRPGFYFVRQELGIDDPQLLKHEDGTCHDYAAAMGWLFLSQSLQRYEDGSDDLVLFDGTAPAPTLTRLEPFGSGAFQLVVRGQWERWR